VADRLAASDLLRDLDHQTQFGSLLQHQQKHKYQEMQTLGVDLSKGDAVCPEAG
jgi:hypothetical protein